MQKGMFALPPRADSCSAATHVRFGPEADTASPVRGTRHEVQFERSVSNFAVSPALLHYDLRLRPVLPASAYELQAPAFEEGGAPSYYHQQSFSQLASWCRRAESWMS